MSEKPDHQRPEHAAFWDKRFSEGVTPWAADGILPLLVRHVETVATAPRILIPGCGHAREAAWLAARGWDVTALDFSAAAIALAAETLAGTTVRLIHADFFTFSAAPFDLVYESAFLCALPRKCWPDYARRMGELVALGGALIGFFFHGEDPKGPPFGIAPEALSELLAPWFRQEEECEVSDSLPVFAGRERWRLWRRRIS